MVKRHDDEKKIYTCVQCNYAHINKTNYEKHLLTKKHLSNMKDSNIKDDESSTANATDNATATATAKKVICEHCNKSYTTSSGLWKHKNKCKEKEHVSEKVINEMIREPIEKNDMMHMFLEYMKEVVLDKDKIRN